MSTKLTVKKQVRPLKNVIFLAKKVQVQFYKMPSKKM